jgi:hypothetical protein
MRTLTQHELTTVTGAGKRPSPAEAIAAIKAALAKRGITLALNKAAGTLTISSPKGTKVIELPDCAPATGPVAG